MILQLKSSLQLHIDGTGPIAEDIGRQVITFGTVWWLLGCMEYNTQLQEDYVVASRSPVIFLLLILFLCRYLLMVGESQLLNFLQE